MTSRRLFSPRRRLFMVAWLTYAFFYLGRVNVAVALPALQAEFGWTQGAVGLLGTALYWSYAAGQLVNGYLGDRLSPRRVVALGLMASAVLNLVFGSLGALGAMVAVWALNGWAQSAGWGPIVRTLSHWFEPSERGRVTAAFAPCSMAGHALSWALAGWLVTAAGWRMAFRVPGALLLAVAAGWYLLARDAPPQRRDDEQRTEPQQAPPATLAEGIRALGALLGGRGLRWAVVLCFASGMIKDALTIWTPSYLAGQGRSAADTVAGSLIVPLCGVAGSAVAGSLVHRMRARSEAAVAAGLALFSALMAGLLWVAGERSTVAGLAGLGGLALGCYGINSLLMTSLPLALGRRGQVSGVAGALDFVSYVGGGLSVAAAGTLHDAWGWGGVFLAWAALGLGMAGLAGGQVRRAAEVGRTPAAS